MQYPQTRYQDTLASGISDTAASLSVTTTAPARTQGILTLGRLQSNTEDVYFTNVVGNAVTISLRGLSTTALTPTQVVGNRKVHSANESVEITTHHNYDTDKFRKSEDETITGKNTFTPVQIFTTPPKGGAAAAATVPSAPTAGTPTSGGSVTDGTHSYKVTFITAAGEETMPSSASSIITCGGGSNTVPLSAIPTGDANSNVTGRKIYRTVAGNTGNYKLLATIADNTTTVYSDTIADGSLGADAPTRATSYELMRYNEAVDTSSVQTVNGVKTYGSIPVLPASDPTTDNQAARKAYVDSRPAQRLAFTSYYLGENVLDRDALSTEDLTNTQGGSDANFGRDAASQGVYQAQSFIAGSVPAAFSMTVSLKKQGTPADNITIEIQTDNAGSPSGTPVTNGTSNTVAGSGLTGSYANTAFTWASVPTLTIGTKYWFVLKRSGANSDTNYYQVQYSSVNAFRSGVAKKYTTTWTTNTGADDDLVFAITGVAATAVKSIFNAYNSNRGFLAFIGFANAAGSQGAQIECQTHGKMTGFSGLTRNSTYFLSATAGQITLTNQGGIIVGFSMETDTLLVGRAYTNSEMETFFANTDLTGAEAETLSSGVASNADSLHTHDSFRDRAKGAGLYTRINYEDNYGAATASSGTVSKTANLVTLTTQASSGASAYTTINPVGGNISTLFDKSTNWFAELILGTTSVQDGFWGINTNGGSANPVNGALVEDHVGYILDDNTLYASVADGATQTKSAALSVTLNQYNKYYITYNGTQWEFFINGTLVYTSTANKPNSNTIIPICLLITREAVAKSFNISRHIVSYTP